MLYIPLKITAVNIAELLKLLNLVLIVHIGTILRISCAIFLFFYVSEQCKTVCTTYHITSVIYRSQLNGQKLKKGKQSLFQRIILTIDINGIFRSCRRCVVRGRSACFETPDLSYDYMAGGLLWQQPEVRR